MQKDQREPDLSTNVPHGQGTESSGHIDIERETESENVPIERERQYREQSEESIERAKERTAQGAAVARAVAEGAVETVKETAKGAAEGFREGVEASKEHVRIVMKGEEPPSTKRTGEATKESTVDRLNDLLRGELASVETYTLALKSVQEEELSSTLRQICESHERRVELLRAKIKDLGGEPALSSGVWGAFARIVQRGADLLGQRAAIAALEEGEDQGKKRYARDLDELEQPARDFVLTELSPEQLRTHDLAQSLQKYVKAA